MHNLLQTYRLNISVVLWFFFPNIVMGPVPNSLHLTNSSSTTSVFCVPVNQMHHVYVPGNVN